VGPLQNVEAGFPGKFEVQQDQGREGIGITLNYSYYSIDG
jgi:hypothetical protein